MESHKPDETGQDEAISAAGGSRPRGGKAGAAKSAKAAPKRARAAASPPLPKSTAVPPPPMARMADVADDDDDDQDASGGELKKQELIAKVVDRADIRKKYAKPVVEAVIDILGETLAEGRELNLQPFGKLKVNRTKETAAARIIIAKIRQSKPGSGSDGAEKEAVAGGED